MSDIAEKLKNDYDVTITLPGLLKHLKQLEKAGIVRRESGIFAKKPDARKTIYILEGKERVEKVLWLLEKNIGTLLDAGVVFSETAKTARLIQGTGIHISEKETERFESLLTLCESKKVDSYLTEEEKKKVKLWRMMIRLLKEK